MCIFNIFSSLPSSHILPINTYIVFTTFHVNFTLLRSDSCARFNYRARSITMVFFFLLSIAMMIKVIGLPLILILMEDDFSRIQTVNTYSISCSIENLRPIKRNRQNMNDKRNAIKKLQRACDSIKYNQKLDLNL